MLVATKLHIPPPPASSMPRRRVTRILQAGLRRRLTLVSAPMGFGKTTVVRDLVSAVDQPCAWLSLNAGDNDPVRFWQYVIAALQTIQPGIGQTAQELLDAPRPPSLETVVTAVINDLVPPGTASAAPPRDDSSPTWLMVLDDYHVIDTASIHASVNFWLDHLPSHLHLVLTTEGDPPLALGRRYGRQEVTTVSTADLRFTAEETTQFLTTVMGLHLSPDTIAVLVERTEGWFAGLQLAAFSLQRHPQPDAFIRTFAGDDRHVREYLIEAVVSQQPDAMQHVLLCTSILERFCGPLCEAVLTDPEASPQALGDGQHILDALVQANLFLVPLDREGYWYRYHHLFAEAMRARLHQMRPDLLPVLQRRAATWLLQQGSIAEAFSHIVAVQDFVWAGRVVEEWGHTLLWRDGEIATLHRWLTQLPPEVIHARPTLCLLAAWARYAMREFEAVEPLLQQAEAHLRGVGDTPVAGTALRALMGETIAVRAMVASMQGTLSTAIELARWALELLPETERPLRGLLTAAEGYIRLFVDEGAAMAALLREAASRGMTPAYTGTLLAACPESSAPSQPSTQLLEPLTPREHDVMTLLADGHTNKAIAAQLFLSPGTVKVHVRQIFRKLDVHRRTPVVARARALGLLTSP